jgi:regulator of nonsense transcripts 3
MWYFIHHLNAVETQTTGMKTYRFEGQSEGWRQNEKKNVDKQGAYKLRFQAPPKLGTNLPWFSFAQLFMSTTQLNKAPPTKPRKERERERKEKEKQQPPGSERLKTVVRRLPPNLPESVFWQSVEAWVTDHTVTWKTYYSGKFRKRYAVCILCSMHW